MRVSGEEDLAVSRREEGRRGDFAAALERAEARRTERGRSEAGRSEAGLEATRGGERLAATRASEARGGGPAAGGEAPRPSGGEGGGAGAGGLRGDAAERGAGQAGDEGSGSGSAPCAAAPRTPEAGSEPARAALTEVVRALPPVIEAFGASGREVLALHFGGGLGVELRRSPDGVEVGLTVPAALRPAARVELAGICQALAARGVKVASAEVRGGVAARHPRR